LIAINFEFRLPSAPGGVKPLRQKLIGIKNADAAFETAAAREIR
jgi:hypothetical protein